MSLRYARRSPAETYVLLTNRGFRVAAPFILPVCFPILRHIWWSMYQRRGWYRIHPSIFQLFSMTRHSPQFLEPDRRNLKLESLPLEIIEEIIFLACTDGGYTGCSLASVSKFIRTISRSARFHSIVLFSDSCYTLDSFLACFKIAKHEAGKEGGVRPRIRHLCLATTPSTSHSFTNRRSRWDLTDVPSWFDLQHFGQLWNHKQWLKNLDDYHAAVQFILQYASEDVETLCLLGSREWSVGHDVPKPAMFVRGVFPRLRELSLAGVQPTLITTSHSLAPLFPVMSRLHIGADSMEVGDFQRWIVDAPRVRILRVTCDNYIITPHFLDEFQEAMRM